MLKPGMTARDFTCLALLLLSTCSRNQRSDPEQDFYSCTTRVVGLSDDDLDTRGRNHPFASDPTNIERVKSAIQTHRDEIRTCYQTTLERRGLKVGTIQVKYAIDGHGKVVRAVVERNDTGDDELACCVVDRLVSWRFPLGPQNGVAELTEPFIFSPDNPFEAARAASAAEFKRFQDNYGNCQESPADREWRERREAARLNTQPELAQPQPAPRASNDEPVGVTGGCKSVPKGSRCGSLPGSVVMAVIAAHDGEIRWCHQTALFAQPRLQGRVQVAFEIGADGRVAHATIERSSTNSAALDCCIARQVATWQFPPPDGGGSFTVSFPFVLESARPQ